jgi:transcription antitermination factor NusG
MGNEPAKMPEKDLEGVRIMVHSGVNLAVNSELIPGKKVEVLSGPFKGVQGELVHVRNKRRLLINAHLLGKSVEVEISSEKIKIL